MFIAEQIFDSMTYEDLYLTLKMVLDEDCEVQEIVENEIIEDFFYLLEEYDLVFVSSDDRIMLTQRGEKLMQLIRTSVELDKKSYKLKTNNL